MYHSAPPAGKPEMTQSCPGLIASRPPFLQNAATLKPNNPGVHYQLFMALSRLKRKDEADRELAIFKDLDEARKARPQSADLDDDDAQNSTPISPPHR